MTDARTAATATATATEANATLSPTAATAPAPSSRVSASLSAPRRSWRAVENWMALVVLLAGLPATALLLRQLWQQAWLSFHPAVLLTALLLVCWLGSAWYVRQRLVNQLRKLSNLVEAVRLGDFSLRGRNDGDTGGYGELVREINTLAQKLRDQRLRTEETQHLLDKVIRDIDVAILAFDDRLQLTLANPAACQLLGDDWTVLRRRNADELQLRALLDCQLPTVLEHRFGNVSGVWRVQAEQFREQGRSQHLLFITDLKRVLRAEELNAWKRLIRVLSHEVNNSLAPIASVSASLDDLLRKTADAPDLTLQSEWQQELQRDLHDGLQLIQQRSQSLTEFIRRYADLARLPPPNRRPLAVAALLQRLPQLLPSRPLAIQQSDAAAISAAQLFADPVQLEQLLINVLKNAHEAMQASGAVGAIEVLAHTEHAQLCLQIADRGDGLGNSSNVFVPFYSTKTGGSGIGLVLSRQIAEAHDGSLQLRNRDGGGCVAEIRLPLAQTARP